MKVLILSDSHGDVEIMLQIIEKEKPDAMIHLGDGKADVEKVREDYPKMPIYNVPGNVDSSRPYEQWIKVEEIQGMRFVLVHGHLMINETKQPKQTDENRISARNKMLLLIDEHEADILLHGHSHEAFMHRTKGLSGKVCWMMNPGCVSREKNVNSKPTYGLLKFKKNGSLEWKIKEVK